MGWSGTWKKRTDKVRFSHYPSCLLLLWMGFVMSQLGGLIMTTLSATTRLLMVESSFRVGLSVNGRVPQPSRPASAPVYAPLRDLLQRVNAADGPLATGVNGLGQSLSQFGRGVVEHATVPRGRYGEPLYPTIGGAGMLGSAPPPPPPPINPYALSTNNPYSPFNPPGGSAMPSNVYKVTANFIEASGAPWAEDYYVSGSTANNAAALAGNVMQVRLGCLHPLCYLRNIRTANVAPIRDTFTFVTNWTGQYQTSNPGQPAPTGLSAVVSLPTSSGKSVLHWWRGLPAGQVSISPTTGFPTPPATLTSVIKAFTTAAAANGLGSRTLTPETKFQLSNLTYNAMTNTSTITYQIPVGGVAPIFTLQTRIVIGLASKKDLPVLNGHWSLVSFVNGAAGGTGTVTIRYTAANLQTTIPTSGYLKLELYGSVNAFNANSGILAYYGTHSTKSIFSNSRGAKHATRIRTSV